MRKFPLVRAFLLLCLSTAFPAIAEISASLEAPPFSASTEVVASGLMQDESVEFESRMVPRMREFLRFWERRGLKGGRSKSQLRVYVQPAPMLSKAAALESLYGASVRGALESLRERVESATSSREIRSELQAFSCRYPPLFHAVAARPASTPLAAFKADVRREHSRIMDLARPIPGFEMDNGFYFEGASGCSVLLLGRSSDPGLRPHPFLSEDVVLHELGHGIIEGLVADHRVVPRVFQETVADLLAHSFLDQNCHGMYMDATTGALKCRRDMNRGGPVLADALWSNEPHTAGDSMRKFFWRAYTEAGLETFVRSFGRSLVTVLKHRPLMLVRELPNDPFHRLSADLSSEHSLMSSLSYEFCQRIGTAGEETCQRRTRELGRLDQKALARLTRHAPTRVGTQGRTVRIGEDRFRVAFTRIHTPTMIELIPRDGETDLASVYICTEKGYYAPEKLGYVKCFPAGPGRSINWTSYGNIRVN